MYTLCLVLFIILCVFLALFVLIQQGKGDLGVSNLSGSHKLFGGSGGQNFFERATWFLGALFVFGALGLSILKSREDRSSILDGVTVPKKQTAATAPVATSHNKAQEEAKNAPAPIATEQSAAPTEVPASAPAEAPVAQA